MSTLDPFALLGPGARVLLKVEEECWVPLTVDLVSAPLVSCHSRPGDVLEVSFVGRPMTAYLGRLECPVVGVQSRVTQEPEGLVLIGSFKVLAGATLVQRRDFVRLEKSGAEVQIATDANPIFTPVKLVNLGGGGLAVSTPGPALPLGSTVALEIKIPDGIIVAKGVVSRSEMGVEGTSYGIRFTEIREGHRDRIVSHVFAQQARVRKAETEAAALRRGR